MQLNRYVNPSPVKSIQRGFLSMTAANQNVSIASVNPAKSFLNFSHYSTSTTVINNIKGRINDSVTLSFNKYGTALDALIEWELVEYV